MDLSQANPDGTLLQRLKAFKAPLLDSAELRQLIAYARSSVAPVLSKEATALLQSFYIERRKGNKPGEHTPVTTRQLESLMRLAEARARAELRSTVTENDVKDVIEIMLVSTF